MKDKILAQLKAKFSGAQLSFLERIAEEYSKTIKDETEIETVLTANTGLIQGMIEFNQKEADRRVTEAVKKREQEFKAEYDKSHPADPAKPPTPQPNTEIEALKQRLDAFEAEKRSREMISAAKEQLKQKNVPEAFINLTITGKAFKDDTELAEFVNSTESAHKAYIQDLTEKGMTANYNTFNAETAPAKAVEQDIKDWAGKK